MAGLGTYSIDDTLTFYANTHDPSTAGSSDASAINYEVYEQTTGTPIVSSAAMSKLNDAGTLGFYGNSLTLSSANGYEEGKDYAILIEATVGGVSAAFHHHFRVDAASVDAAGIRSAVGLASANLDTQLGALPTTAEVNAEVDTALSDIHLDHLLAVDYDPASKPGTATALLNELIESDGGVSRFTTNALEQGPSGSGASAAAIADAVWDEARSGHTTAGTYGEHTGDSAMRGTDSAYTGTPPTAAAIRTEIDTNSTQLAAIVADTNELQSDDVPGLIGALNDIAATDIVSGGAITTSGGAVSNVTLVATTTTNTDMRGTDSAATATNLATVDSNVDAIKLKTDSLTFTKANELDSNLQSVNGVTLTGDGSGTPFDV